MGSVKLSQKHGVNPSMLACFVCGNEYGVALLGRLKGDAEAPHQFTSPHDWCDDCRKMSKKGVWLVKVRDGEEGDNPHRLGHVVLVKDEALRRMITPAELAEDIIKQRMAYVPAEVWEKVGIDARIEADNVPGS